MTEHVKISLISGDGEVVVSETRFTTWTDKANCQVKDGDVRIGFDAADIELSQKLMDQLVAEYMKAQA